jgi:DNA polymerase (family X)
MNAKAISRVLAEIAVLMELKGENAFKIRAYENAARILDDLKVGLNDFLESAEEGKVKGLGESLTEIISTLHTTGKHSLHEKLKKEFPEDLLQLLKVPGLGAKKVRILYEQLNITNLKELQDACIENKIAALKGFGDKTQQNILHGIKQIYSYQGQYLSFHAFQTALNLVHALAESGYATKVEVAGSLRRRKETVKDIDIVASSKKAGKLMQVFVSHDDVGHVVNHGDTKSSVILNDGMPVDLRVVNEKQFPSALLHFTGSKEHNTLLRGLAKKKNLKLNEYGLFFEERELLIKSEKDIFNELGLCYIPPELREATYEIEAAKNAFSQKKEFPKLIDEADIQGVIHAHTTYSDGKNSLEELAAEVKKRGFHYLGISDHSQSATYARGLKPDSVKKQHDEIDFLNDKLKPFIIFKGIESDILPNGSLDYKDNLLEKFDFVIASVHSNFNMSETEMTKRIITAIKNPFTTILGHPSGRLLLQRDAYALDMPRIFKAAKEHGVAIELNASPHRLDLDWRLLKQAKDLGIQIPISPDAHRIEHLRYIGFAVGVARKGWLTKDDVLNCLTTSKIKEYFLRRK